MNTVKELEDAVTQLAPEQYAAFREWFLEYESDLWDAQMASDAQSGKLDKFAEEAIAELEAGKTSTL